MLGNVLGELSVIISADLDKLHDGLDAAKNASKKATEKIIGDFETAGKVMMTVGGAVTAGFIAAAKAANDEQVGINKLAAQLKNVGVDYGKVQKQLDKVIASTMKKTGVADDKQREALGELVVITGDYEEALKLLPLALDLAASKGMDAASAAQLIGRVAEGNTGILSRYGIVLQDGATAAEALAAVQQKVGGVAEAGANKFDILKNSLDDLGETIGGALLGDMDNFLSKAVEIVDKITEWIAQNPELVRTIALVGGAILGAGGLLYAVTTVARAVIALNAALIILQGVTGVGLLKVLAGLAIAGGTIWGMTEMINKASEGSLPGMASGGVVTSPTVAKIGERGPEAVVPLDQMGGMFQLFIDGEQITDVIERRLYTRVNASGARGYV